MVRRGWLVGAVVGIVAGGASGSARAERPLVVTVGPEGTPWAELALGISQRVERATGGKVNPRTALGGAFGDEVVTAKQCVAGGRILFWGGSAAALATVVPELEALEIPFLFNDDAEVDAVLSGPALAALRRVLERHGLALWGAPTEVGWRSFGGKKALRRPEDFVGLAVRSQESAIHLDLWRALGAKPRGISVIDTLSVLEGGDVVAFDQSPLFMMATSWSRTITHYTLSRHIYQPGLIVMCKGAGALLSAPQRTKVLERSTEETARCTRAVRKLNADVLTQLTAQGVQVVTPSRAERLALAAGVPGVRAAFEQRASAPTLGLLKVIDGALKGLRKRGLQASDP